MTVFDPSQQFKRVTRDEFRAYLEQHPELQHNATTFCEPIFHGYYDLSRLPKQNEQGEPHPASTEALRAKCWYAEDSPPGGPPGEDHFYVRQDESAAPS